MKQLSAKTNEDENKKSDEDSKQTKSWFFEKKNKSA